MWRHGFTSRFACIVVGVLVLAGSASAALIYQETFEGGAGPLNDRAPKVTQDDAVWAAGDNVSANGDLGSMFTAVLPFEPEIGEVYEVAAEFDNEGDWAALGFFNEAANLNTRFMDNAPVLWALVRQNGAANNDQVFLGPSTAGGLGDAASSSAAEIRIRLETTSATSWTVTWFFDGAQAFQETIDPADYEIHYVGFGVNGMFSSVSGRILRFEVTDSTNDLLANNPKPADGATDVYIKTTLKWLPGRMAESRHVYFGTDADAVAGASLADPMGVLVAQDLDVNEWQPSEPLTLGTTYYWRVDEVNGAPDFGVNTGTVWSFTAEPVGFPIDVNAITATASSQSSEANGPEKTIDGSGLVGDGHSTNLEHMWMSASDDPNIWIQYDFDRVYKLYQIWVWNSNQAWEKVLKAGVKEAQIELSLDGQTWSAWGDPVVFNQAPGQAGYVANTVLDMNGVFAKAVRINVLNNWGNGSIVQTAGLSEVRFLSIPTQARLPRPADGAQVNRLALELGWRPARDVTSQDVYLGADANDLQPVGTVTEPMLAVQGLLYQADYVWRVDSVIDGETYPGPLWHFSTPDRVVVDDMESYNDDDNRIFDKWVDGYNKPDNGSVVGYEVAHFAEQTVVHEGGQSMPFSYQNTGGLESYATLSLGGQDWTAGGLTTLTLYLLGERDNQGGQFYVEIGTAGGSQRVTSTVSLDSGLWTQVNIDLTGLSGLNQVQSLRIGVTGTGSGRLYIDDIRLYREAPEVVTPVDPGTAGLVLWYPMEDSVNDASGNGYHGTAQGTPFYEDSLDGLGRALSFDGIDDYVDMPVGDLVAGLGQSTFAGWIQIASDSTGNWQRLFDVGTGTDNYLFVSPRTGTAGPVRVAILTTADSGETGVTSASELTDGWHHIAAVFGDGTLTLYVDAWPAGTVPTERYPMDLGVTTQNWLGESQWENDSLLAGAIDEFRIYNRALSAGEVRFLAGDR